MIGTTLSINERFRVLCQRGMTWFMTYPNATPPAGSAELRLPRYRSGQSYRGWDRRDDAAPWV